jgi:hypothetical protein
MISEKQAAQLVHQHINRLPPSGPHQPEMIVIRVVERPLDWIVYWTSKSYWENPDNDQTFAANAPYLVSREDGTLFETEAVSPIEDGILATEHKIQKQLQRGV